MHRRTIVLSPRYLKRASALGVVGRSERSRAVGAVVRALAQASALPAAGDTRALIPPTGDAFVRRVPGRNLWLWYRMDGEKLYLVHLSSDPPVPADE